MKKYNIGLDIGTTSVGWAVVENNTQKIIRKGKGKDRKALWGVRLFDPASTAEERRKFRSTRRRYERRRRRIELLQKEFEVEINKVDRDFFTKLKESKYNENDSINKTILLSADDKKKVKEYNEKYKTIYHLRNRLIKDDSKEDIRLVYLAIHHIIKYRGNFNETGDNFDVDNLNISERLKATFDTLFECLPNLNLIDNYADFIDFDLLSNIVLEKSKNDLKIKLKNTLSDVSSNKYFASEFTKLILGYKFDIKKLFLLEDIDSKMSISFNGTDFEDNISDLEDTFGQTIVTVLEELKNLYNAIFLKKLFKDSLDQSISALMVKRYNCHKEDLRFLKDLFSYDRKIYNKFFRNKNEECLYELYIHNKKTYIELKSELNKYIPVLLDKIDPSSELSINSRKYIDRIENDEFLPRITDKENGKYPYQLNKTELIKIIENQGKYYPFLLDNIDGTYKIVKLLQFKIPYYVGPLVSRENSKFAWMERKIDGVAITPYNFDQIVDKEKTAEEFILRMISHCTYLLNEYALPNNSLLYCKYKVLNELKQIKVNNERLTLDEQHTILSDLFMKTNGSITDSKFKKYLYGNPDFSMYGTDITVTGYSSDGKFANNMQPYVDFFGENGIFMGTDYKEDDAEEIIKWVTIFEDKDILESKIRKAYSKLNEQKIKRIISLKYSGWGSLSKELLTKAYYKDKKTGILKSIMDILFETDENFMQIINNAEYNFQKMISESNTLKESNKLSYDMVDALTTSPSTKKGIYQALRVVDEIIKYMGYGPENVMIEMARGEDEIKQRKDDRVNYLIKLYETAKNITNDYDKIIDELRLMDKEDKKISTEKLFTRRKMFVLL